MLLEDLKHTEKRLETLNRFQERKLAEDKIRKYTEALEFQSLELNACVNWLQKAENLGMNISSDTVRRCEEIANLLGQKIRNAESGNTDWDKGIFNDSRDKLDRLKMTLTKQWTEFYQNRTQGVFGLLRIVQMVSPERSLYCQQSLKKFEKWNLNQNLASFEPALAAANQLIEQTDMENEDVRDFLMKVRKKEATLDDITGPIRIWIEKNNLGRKIHVSFSAGS